ncbi:MAG: hypothetical protein ABUR63_06210 [Verrucomicrobiota bacterium]
MPVRAGPTIGLQTVIAERAIAEGAGAGVWLRRDSLSNQGLKIMSKSQDAKKNVKKAPSKTPKEKKEAKRLKKAGK